MVWCGVEADVVNAGPKIRVVCATTGCDRFRTMNHCNEGRKEALVFQNTWQTCSNCSEQSDGALFKQLRLPQRVPDNAVSCQSTCLARCALLKQRNASRGARIFCRSAAIVFHLSKSSLTQ